MHISIYPSIYVYPCKRARGSRVNLPPFSFRRREKKKRHYSLPSRPTDHLGKRSWKGDHRESFGAPGLHRRGGTMSMHALIIYWRPSEKQELPIYSLTPFNHLIFLSLSQTLCICNMICIYFYNNLHKVNGDVLLDIIE